MSQRYGSNINSEFFMADPVPVLSTQSNTASYNTEVSFLIKGDTSDSSNMSSYEHQGGNDDIFIVNGEGGSFQLHRKTLKETLEELKKYSSVHIKNLSPEHTESFTNVIESLRLLYGSQALYDIILADIRTVFSDVKNVIPGTVAAFFIGCFNDDKFVGPLGCSPKCAASLPPTENTPGYSNCDDLVLIYIEDSFSSLNDKRSPHAYIHITSSQFSGFTKDNIAQLSDSGIENASLVYGNDDGTYSEITTPIPINQLPQKVSASSTPPPSSSSSTSTAGIVFAIVIIIIIILLFVVLYTSYNR